MKKVLIGLCLISGMSSVALAQDVDNRPAHKKAHDMYVEPTLRVTTTTTTTKGSQQNQVVNVHESTQVFNHQGNIIGDSTQTLNPQPAVQPSKPVTPPKKAPAVQQPPKEITDMSRPMQ